MKNNFNQEQNILWGKIEDNIQVSYFTSSNSEKSKIYVKRFDSFKIDPNNNITIFLLHDICQYHGRFLAFINWTRKNYPGISFVAVDYLGHGLSSGTRGHVDNFENLVDDALFIINKITINKEKDEKCIILGHGLGGLVALDLINRYQNEIEKRIDGLVISNFILRFSSMFFEIENKLILVSETIKKLMAHSRLVSVLTGSEMLSAPKDILMYEQDPLIVHRPTFITFKEIQKKVDSIYQDSYFIDKPILILKSEKNNVTNSRGINYFSRGVKKELLNEKNYSLMKHDLYNEIDNEIVFKDIMNWIKNI